ncbi:hypothetical protein [Actinacidiphila sp. ITFR-21]|uniref:hypothetical protein n=1 Tax=Actinacidiphila sp. ITFR-21 TaxID=3075199 RepID=UPI002888FAB5|nr:hypothetical protein [Streptomyces sp. ITFR-21]WNI19172.1 hypothetical protein RLT57_28955 [Streptomyces sp. ITFR-21]
MAKQGGLGDALYYAGYDMSGDVQSLGNVGGGPALLDFTDITQSAMARQGGLRDGRIEWTSFFNPGLAANAAHTLLSALPRGDVLLTYCRGTTTGSPAACLNGKQVNYDGTRGNDGNFTFAVSGQASSYGLEWGHLLTAGLRTDTTATNGTSYDTGASAAFGAQAYLHVSAFTGTDVTVKIQDSADNSSFADVTGLAFTAVTAAPGTQRIAIANTATVRRYVRASTVTTGGFTSVSFAVVINKNECAGVSF